jgi:hypothetical protein
MDEYQLEIQSLRSRLVQLREQQADPALIDEYEAEVRNLTALYTAARDTFVAGENDARVRAALSALGFGEWKLENVYSFVYDASMDLDADGRALATEIEETDYAGSLVAALDDTA